MADQAIDGDAAGLDAAQDASAPVWAVFGDLMAGLLGAFVLILVLVIGVQMELASQLGAEVQRRQAEQQRRMRLESTLEQALAGPLAAGRITLVDGRIGIAGHVLFAANSDALQPEGRQLLHTLAAPLAGYLQARDALLMVSGFTDDRLLRQGNRAFDDNLELSAQRALTVTRTLVEAGLPSARLFAAAFGPEHPVASNSDATGRARNRRVELATVPRTAAGASAPVR